jgi:hypothetical protein
MTQQAAPTKTAGYTEYSSWGRGEAFLARLIEELAKERAANRDDYTTSDDGRTRGTYGL